MARARLEMAQEGQLWEMALEHLGSDGLLQADIEMWIPAAPPPRPLVEHLSINQVSQDVLSILKIAQQWVGASCQVERLMQAKSRCTLVTLVT